LKAWEWAEPAARTYRENSNFAGTFKSLPKGGSGKHWIRPHDIEEIDAVADGNAKRPSESGRVTFCLWVRC
jgi:hypothetical protein